jgi:hypothetical protein
MQVIIKTIDHKKQPYDTCGDWRWENKKGKPINQTEALARANTDDCVLRINVSNLGSWRLEMLVAVHELVETLMCLRDGVLVEDVDAFDKAFEAARKKGNQDEPGDDPKAPYVNQHCVATAVERLLCAQLGCTWDEYCNAVESLPTIPSKE